MEQKITLLITVVVVLIICALAYTAFSTGTFGSSAGQFSTSQGNNTSRADLMPTFLVSYLNPCKPNQTNVNGLNLTIKNIGNANAIAFTIRADDTTTGTAEIASSKVGQLAPNAVTGVGMLISKPLSIGNHTIKVTVDSTNAVLESNEGNNQITTVMVCR